MMLFRGDNIESQMCSSNSSSATSVRGVCTGCYYSEFSESSAYLRSLVGLHGGASNDDSEAHTILRQWHLETGGP